MFKISLDDSFNEKKENKAAKTLSRASAHIGLSTKMFLSLASGLMAFRGQHLLGSLPPLAKGTGDRQLGLRSDRVPWKAVITLFKSLGHWR